MLWATMSLILISTPLASAISYFQAIVLGVLQGVTELFPISSLGHTVLFPTLFGWNSLVDAQSESESFWLAFVVMLHVGSAIGLLIYYWSDWVQIVKAFFRTLGKRRAETGTERLAWLIIIASIPAGAFGLVFEHQLRTLTAKPEIAAILLMVNGLILFAAERFRRRTAVRELAVREGLSPEGGVSSTRSSIARHSSSAWRNRPLCSPASAATVSRWGRASHAAWTTVTPPASPSCSPRRSSSPPVLSSCPTCSATSATASAVRRWSHCISAAITAVFTVAFLVRWFKTRTLIPFAIYCLVFGGAMVIYTTA